MFGLSVSKLFIMCVVLCMGHKGMREVLLAQCFFSVVSPFFGRIWGPKTVVLRLRLEGKCALSRFS